MFSKNSLFDFVGVNDGFYRQNYGQAFIDAIKEDRKTIFNQDTIRTLVLVLLCAGTIYMYLKDKLKEKWAIVVFGMLILFDLVGVDGSYDGGIIAPGVNLSLEALYLAAARLPKVTLKPLSNKNSIVGKNTVNAMESGIYWGYVSMIEGLINKVKILDEYKNYKVVATGGLSDLFKKSLPCIDYIEEDLTLIGLVNLYLNNLKNNN